MRCVAAIIVLVFAGCCANHTCTGVKACQDEQRASVTVHILPASTEAQAGCVEMTDPEGRQFYVGADPVVTERDIVSARVERDQRGRYTVVIKLSDDGAKRLHAFTSDHLGEYLAIVVDGELTSAPKIHSAVSHTAVITGDFTAERAEEIAAALSDR